MNAHVPPGATFLCILVGVLHLTFASCTSESPGPSRDSASVDPAVARHLVTAQELLETGNLGPALERTEMALAVDSTEADAYFLQGRIYTQLRRYADAERAYERVLSIDPDRQGPWFNIGNNYFRRRQFRQALKHYLKELDKYPSPELYVHMAQAYSNLNKVDSALHAYREALVTDSAYAPAHVWLGQLYKDQGQYAQALDHTRRGLALDTSNVKYRFFTGQLSLSTGRPREAITHLKRVVREQPYHYAAHYNLGRAFAQLGRREQAQEYLARADSLQQIQAEIARLQTMARQKPEKPERWLALAQTLEDGGRLKRAREAYNVALSLLPGSVGIRNNLANIALALGDTREAIRRYREILRDDSSQVEIWVNLGVVYAQTGRRQQAIKAWKGALRTDPDHARAREYLGKIGGEP